MTSDLTPRERMLIDFGLDRHLAHAVLFQHRHPNKDPPFREAMIDDWHSSEQYLCELAFRGSSKSTTAEEAIVIQALYQEFKYCVIFGASFDLAAERLHAIRREFERNELIIALWGDMRGTPWGDDKLELANGVVIKAMGRGEALRGTKGEEERPDLVVLDDIEDRASLSTPRGREKIQAWVFGDVIPAMTDPTVRRVRVLANTLHEECLGIKLKHPDSGFRVRTTPIEYLDEDGERQPTWPDRFPLEAIDTEKARYYAVGRGLDYEAEYNCDPSSPASRPFKREMFLVVPRVKTWQATYCMFDPARTTGAKAATTGFAAWSWIEPKLVIWDAWGRKLMPDQIITAMFEVNERFQPIHIGFEEDGLNQWALQPIRQAMAERHTMLPLKPMKAPQGKLDFIRGMQPTFLAGFVSFAKPLPDLEEQLLGFPTGSIDAPNALAYAWRMRPGAPIYDDFRGEKHVADGIEPVAGRPLWLCLNATRSLLTGVVLQVFDGQVRIFGDAIREGQISDVLVDFLADVQLRFGPNLRLTGGPIHFDQYNNVGLRQALARVPRTLQNALPPDRGRPMLASLLQQERRGFPMLMVSDQATWTLNAFAGGYARALMKQGVLADYADDNAYKVLMEGLESFVGLMELGSTDDEPASKLNAETHDGRAYRSMMGGGTVVRSTKGDWTSALRG